LHDVFAAQIIRRAHDRKVGQIRNHEGLGDAGRACLDSRILIGVLGRSRQTPFPLKSRIAKSALRHVLLNESLRLGFSGLILLGAWAMAEATSAIKAIANLYFIAVIPQR
jgi:hypothetical protein